MTRGRYAAYVGLLVMFYFAQINYWSFSLGYAANGQGVMTPGQMIRSIGTGSWSRQLGVLSIGIFAVFLLIRDQRRNLYIQGSMGVAIFFFFWWAFASIVWSGDPYFVVRRVFSFTILWFAAFAVASYYKPKEVLYLLFLGGLAFIGLGLAAELSLGTFAPANPLYRFCGTLHPNHQAWNCVGLAFSGIALGSTQRNHRLFFFSASALGIAALVLTKSRTSVGAFVVAIVVYGALVSTRKQKMLGMVLVPVLLCASIPFLVLDRAEVASVTERTVLLGRNVEKFDTLNSRIPLWRSGFGFFADRPLLGYGFNAFESPQRIIKVERKAGWAAATFHSEYFDLLLGVGCIGAITYLFIILSGLGRTLHLFKLRHHRYHAIECAIIVFYLATMLLENPGVQPNILTFVFFTILIRRGLLLEHESHRTDPLYSTSKSCRPHALHSVHT